MFLTVALVREDSLRSFRRCSVAIGTLPRVREFVIRLRTFCVRRRI